MKLPYLIQDLAGIGGTLKQRAEDFVVHEVPRYEPCGDGEHVMAEIEKVGLSTYDAIDLLARRLKVPRREFGYAGLKDTNAVTRQWFTVRGITPEALVDAADEKIKVLYADRHRNKLRVGHLAGNRFRIKVRDVDPMKVVTLSPAIRTLGKIGMPNYFGPQRFGRRDRNDELGLAFARRETSEILALLLGKPASTDDPDEQEARRRYESGDYNGSLAVWPRRGKDERVALSRLIEGVVPDRVVAGVDRRVQGLWLSAAQSRLFNSAVAARIGSLNTVVDGDLAYKHENGATFRVVTAETEMSRAENFEISATGPMIGLRMQVPKAVAAEIERAALTEGGLPREAVDSLYNTPATQQAPAWLDQLRPGGRRPLRVRPNELHASSGIDEHGPYIEFGFVLPAGAYATVLLREFMRSDAD